MDEIGNRRRRGGVHENKKKEGRLEKQRQTLSEAKSGSDGARAHKQAAAEITDSHATSLFPLTRGETATLWISHNEITGPSLKSRGRKTKPTPPDCWLVLPPRETRLVEPAPLLSALS